MSFLKTLIDSDIDSKHGIKVTVDAPTGNDAMLNVKRPAVIRQEYGLNVNVEDFITPSESDDEVERFFYGQTFTKTGYNQVGTYPQDQYTRLMPDNIRKLGQYLLDMVEKSQELEEINSLKMCKKQ